MKGNSNGVKFRRALIKGKVIIGPNGPIADPENFKIPEPYHAWCHRCDKGFMSIDELQRHEKEDHLIRR